jgi:hypothetical protein
MLLEVGEHLNWFALFMPVIVIHYHHTQPSSPCRITAIDEFCQII